MENNLHENLITYVMNVIFISIIVPVYNCVKWIGACIESIVNLNPVEGVSVEIILVDDGSMDGSGKICDQYAQKYRALKVFHTKNQGVSCARNHGIKHSIGNWIMFVDGDDILESHTLQVVHNALLGQYDMIRFGFYRFRGNKKFSICPLRHKIDIYEYRQLVIRRHTMLGVVGGLYKHSLFLENNISFSSDIKYGEDWLVLFKLLSYTHDFLYINTELYGYRVNEESVTRHKIDFVRTDAMMAFNLILKYAHQTGYYVSQKDIWIARSDLRREMKKTAILCPSKRIFDETSKALRKYGDQSVWKDIRYSRKLKHKILFCLYEVMNWWFHRRKIL